MIFVFSNVDRKVVLKQRQKHMQRIGDELQQIEQSVAAGRYNDEMTWVKRRNVCMGAFCNSDELSMNVNSCHFAKQWRAIFLEITTMRSPTNHST